MNKRLWIDYSKVREMIDFTRVLQNYNIEFPEGKTQIKITCPFHDDKTPSCSINTVKNNFQCFGCGAQGNALEFITLMEDKDPDDKSGLHSGVLTAIEIMGHTPSDFKKQSKSPKSSGNAHNKKSVSGGTKSGVKPHTEENERKSGDEKPEANEVLNLLLTIDGKHPYLTEVRGLDTETIELFGLGYCSRGIMKRRVVFPIHNKNGELVAYVGRYASENIPDEEARYKLPSTFYKSLELYNLHRAIQIGKRHLVIVEGYWSAIRLHQAGIPVVAVMGRTVSEEQAKLIVDAGFRFVTLLLDGDEEGRSSIPDALNILGRHVYARAQELADGEKPDSMPDEKIDALR